MLQKLLIYLFRQNKILVAIAIAFMQFEAAGIIESAIHHPMVPRNRIPLIILVCEAIACGIGTVSLLHSFRSVARINELLGMARAIALTVVAFIIEALLTQRLNSLDPEIPWPYFAFMSLVFSVIISIILVLVKGSSPYLSPSIFSKGSAFAQSGERAINAEPPPNASPAYPEVVTPSTTRNAMTASTARQNPFLSLLDRARAIPSKSNGHGLRKVQIPQATAIDLVSMSADEWRAALGAAATDEAVDKLLTGTTTTGMQALNGLELRGLLLFVAPDAKDTELRIL